MFPHFYLMKLLEDLFSSLAGTLLTSYRLWSVLFK